MAGTASIVFFVLVVVIGFFVIMNLFVSILLEAFGGDDDEEEGGGDEAKEGEGEGEPDGKAAGGGGGGLGSIAEEALPYPQDHSLLLFGPHNSFRLLCQQAHTCSSTHVCTGTPMCTGTHMCAFTHMFTSHTCVQLSESSGFDSFIIFLIIVSSIALALDVPRLDPASALAFYLAQATLVF